MSKQEIDEDLDRWYDEEVKESTRSGMQPGAFETRFGPASGYGTEDAALSSDEPLSLTIGGRTLQFLGRIDRIDWDAGRTRFRVMDYKTGKYSMKLADVLKGGSLLQLPLYVHAASRALGLSPSAGEAQYFYPTTRGAYRRHVLGAADLAGATQAFEQAITTIADGVDSGFFAPRPEDYQCRYCDFKTICDQRIGPIMERKAGDERGKAYRDMRELA
jgi:RecB family exonuclease